MVDIQGRIQDFKLRGAHLKKNAPNGGSICGVFRVKNHDFTPKNLIVSNFKGGGGGAPGAPPPRSAPDIAWSWDLQLPSCKQCLSPLMVTSNRDHG